jgi:transposase InsO family protein
MTKTIKGVANASFYESVFQTSPLYPLKLSTILDSGSTLHVFNDLSRFHNFKKASRHEYITAGSSEVPILGYGNVNLRVTRPNGSKGILRLKDVAFCTDFNTNLVSFDLLQQRGYYWDNKGDNNFLVRKDDSVLCAMEKRYGQQVIEYVPSGSVSSAFIASHLPRRCRKSRLTSRDPRPDSKGDARLWHLRLGHPGPMSLHKLGVNALGVKLNGPKTTECQHCSLAKIKRQISRRPPDRERDKPCFELHIDWTDLEEAHAGFVRVMFINDVFSGRSFPYFMTTHGEERETLRILKDFISWIRLRYKLDVGIIRSDNELSRKKTLKWLRTQGITFEPSAPRTQAQNGSAERSGGVIIEKSRAMRIGANLPHDLWDEIVNCAVYLRDRTPREFSQGWISPYEKFHSFLANEDSSKKPQLAHLKAYGCRAYAMTSDAQLKKKRLRKLDPRAHIGYLVGYDSTNIYRIWIPHKGIVISTRDVIFDETKFFDNRRTDLSDELIAELNLLVEKIKLPDAQAKNEAILEDDEEILESSQDDDDDIDIEPIKDFNEVEDLELAKALEDAYLTPPPSEDDDDSPCAFHVQYPINQEIDQTGDSFDAQGVLGDATKGSFNAASSCDDRFEDFACEKITSTHHGVFNAGRKFNLDSRLRESLQQTGRKRDVRLHKANLPPPPQSIRDLETHPLMNHFKEAQRSHLESHRQMKSFQEMEKKHAKGQQILSSMWVFVYKTDKHGFLQKCKARLVVCGNQQAPGDLPTRATTLASMAFRALMAITAKFDLETIQMDAVNAFVHCDLDEVVYMKMPPGFNQGKRDKVLRLRKALYGLRRSPLLWQRNLTSSLRELGFKEVPQEPCVMLKGGVIIFFYVDDIVFCHRKGDAETAQEAIKELKKEYQMSILGELKWFLGIHVLRDRSKRLLWLSQEAYVEKIAKQYEIDLNERLPDTPMSDTELLPTTYLRSIRPTLKSSDEGLSVRPSSIPKVADASTKLYQKKMGSMLYAATTTRPDIAFAVSRLTRFNQDPSLEHHRAADRVIQYLYGTRSRAICYGDNDGMNDRRDDGGDNRSGKEAQSFICASDASFADNTVDRKSSQGYIMTLFGGPIAWRANKQDTVTTSSTEAELLALSQTAKEAIFISRLFKAMTLKLNEPLIIDCDNTQTLRLIKEDTAKLITKLRHVDIHQHWLRQEHAMKRVIFRWKATKDMLADGLTKALPKQKFWNFVSMIGMVDIRERLDTEKRMEEMKEQLLARRKDPNAEITVHLTH